MPLLNCKPYLINSDARLRTEDSNRAVWVLDWILLLWICGLLAFGPLAFGAVQEWAVFVLEGGAVVCLILWALGRLMRGYLEISRNVLFVPILMFAAVVSVQLLSGRTAYWYVTWQNALLWAAYGMFFFVATQLFRRTVRIRAFALFLTTFGFLIALFAMVQQFTWNGKLYWVVPNSHGGWVYGPYVNHAHYAGLMELLVPIPLVFAMMGSWSKPFRVLFGFAAMLMASTIFLSRSLGGMLAFTTQVAALGTLVVLQRERSRRQVLFLLMLGTFLAGWLLLLSPGGIVERIARLHDPLGQAGAGDRLVIVKDSFKMIAARPILGWGLGTFSVVYPSFRSFYTNYFVNEAHNDYVQAAVETGVVGLAILCGFVAIFYRYSLRNIEHWRTDVRHAACLAAIIGVTGILVHSFSDFNLHIPANASLFFVLCAIATGDFGNQGSRYWRNEEAAFGRIS